MLAHLFQDHPKAVGESYAQHAGIAAGFGLRLIGAGLACLVHALIPGLFVTTGSRTIMAMHGELTSRCDRAARGEPATAA